MDRRQAADACLFEAIVLACDDALLSVCADGLVSSWNPAAARLFGYSQSEALGMALPELLPQYDPGASARDAGASPGLSTQSFARDRAGQLLPVLVSRTPIDDPVRAARGWLLSVHPLLARSPTAPGRPPHAYQMNVYESLVECSDDAIITKTLSGVVTSWNPGAQRMFGYAAGEMIGEPITKLFPAERHDEEEIILQRIAQGERVEHFETVRLHKDGSRVHVSVTISPLRDASGRVVGASKIARDIGERMRAAQAIWRQAHQDALTGVPNRNSLRQHLQLALEQAGRQASELGVLYIDIDHFKAVNDSLGHAAGDNLLVALTQRLRAALRSSDVLARLGGDEFAVLLPVLDDAAHVHTVCDKLHAALRQPFAYAGHALHVSASIGVALHPRDGDTPDELLRRADLAMYQAKRDGRARSVCYEPAMDQQARARLLLAADLRRAVQHDELHLLYQPVVRCGERRPAKFEALLRWRHPGLGLVPPGRFIPMAEEAGLITELGEWVYRRVAAQACRWSVQHAAAPQISFNVSPLQLNADIDPTRGWAAHLLELGLQPRQLVIEVTETVILDRGPRILERLRRLRAEGFQIAVDDFGTGQSNLASLSRVEVDYLKIDQSLIRKLPGDARKLAICEAVVAMAHRLGIEVVAEGIETEEELQKVQEIACDYGQGYLFARPLEAEQAVRCLQQLPEPPQAD